MDIINIVIYAVIIFYLILCIVFISYGVYQTCLENCKQKKKYVNLSNSTVETVDLYDIDLTKMKPMDIQQPESN
jgi:hypothetical protein